MDDGFVFLDGWVGGPHENCVITTDPFQPLYGETSGSGEGRRCLEKVCSCTRERRCLAEVRPYAPLILSEEAEECLDLFVSTISGSP